MIIAADDDKGESYRTAEINAGLTDEASYRISIPKYWRVPDPEESSGKMQRLVDLSTQSRSHSFWERQQIFVELLKMMDEGQKETISSPAWIVAEKKEAYIKRNYRGEVTNQTLSELLHCHPNYHCTLYERSLSMYALFFKVLQGKIHGYPAAIS
jgi:hypothetical protein